MLLIIPGSIWNWIINIQSVIHTYFWSYKNLFTTLICIVFAITISHLCIWFKYKICICIVLVLITYYGVMTSVFITCNTGLPNLSRGFPPPPVLEFGEHSIQCLLFKVLKTSPMSSQPSSFQVEACQWPFYLFIL